MLNMKLTSAVALSVAMISTPVYALEDVKVIPERFALFNGSTPAIEKYFVSENGADSLLFKTANGYTITGENVIRSTLPGLKQNSKNGKYAMISTGQCATFVQSIVEAGHSSSWVRGDKVTGYWDGNALVGKTIATFGPNGKYENSSSRSHIAVVISAWRSAPGSGPIDSVWVVDANYVGTTSSTNQSLRIGRHRIDTKGKGVTSNLDNYYIVRH